VSKEQRQQLSLVAIFPAEASLQFGTGQEQLLATRKKFGLWLLLLLVGGAGAFGGVFTLVVHLKSQS
jgi:hypothetical protein